MYVRFDRVWGRWEPVAWACLHLAALLRFQTQQAGLTLTSHALADTLVRLSNFVGFFK